MKSHTPLAKFIHWSFSILYAYGIFKQVGDLSELEDPALLNFEILFAVAFLVIVFIRYFYMKDTETLLGANIEIRKGHLFIAKSVHTLVYFTLVMLPLTGLLIAGLFSIGAGGIELAIGLHEFSAFLSYVLIAVHVGASFYSKLKGEGIWNAMTPFWKEKEKKDSRLISYLEKTEDKVYETIEKALRL
tara:strand:+ start:472 stop:1035 length:564 start_codon:yes stop_codon:yes gene_type:complete